jgi:hypothetical protein
MSSMKRVQLAVLFLIAAALLAGMSGRAAALPAKLPGTAQLAGGGDPETGASGYVTLDYKYRSPYWYWVTAVSCQGLTPGATYRFEWVSYALPPQPSQVGVVIAVARADGSLAATSWLRKSGGGYFPTNVTVYRVDPGGVKVWVLSGTFVWR